MTALRQFGNTTVVENTSTVRDAPFYSPGGGGGDFPVYRVGVDGPASWFDPPVSYWAQSKASGGQAAVYAIPENISVKHLPGPRLADNAGGMYVAHLHARACMRIRTHTHTHTYTHTHTHTHTHTRIHVRIHTQPHTHSLYPPPFIFPLCLCLCLCPCLCPSLILHVPYATTLYASFQYLC